MSAFGTLPVLAATHVGRQRHRPGRRIPHPRGAVRREGVADRRLTSAYARQASASCGGERQRSLASRLRFCAVAVSNTSSVAPLKPRSRSRSSFKMRFICANRTSSTFLRSRRDRWKASVLASARTWSRTSSLTSRVTLRATDVVHLGFNAQIEQSFLLAL
jgi:hypothetical protein